MDLDELRSAQSRERQASQLQHLRDGFYEEAASFIRGLRTERKRATERSTYDFPYDDPEVQRLTNEIQTAEEVVESLYERRVGKVVKMASFDAAGMAVDAEGLTAEESDLFETLVGDIEANRARVLDALSGGGSTKDADEASSPKSRSTDQATGSPTPPAEGSDEPVPSSETGSADEATDGPVHIGSGPAADGPVSTADEAAQPASERSPKSAAGEVAESTPEPAHEGSDGGGRGPPPTANDAMDAASAMGGESTGRSDEVPGGVPDGETPSVPDAGSEPAETVGAAGTTETTGVSGAGSEPVGDHQPVPPAEGPPGAGSESGTPPTPDGTDGTPADTTGAANESAPPSSEAGGGAPGTDAGGRPADAPDPATAPPDTDADGSTGAPSSEREAATGTLVRVTTDVGEIFGVDGRSYDLAAGDVAVLPPDNAAVLVEDSDAERLQSAIPFSNRS